MNARAFPGTAPLVATLGDKVRIRLGNLSPMDHHPIHLHGHALSGDKGQKMGAALKQLDSSVTDLHSAADEGNQADSEKALKTVESALDQLKTQDPEGAFKNMH
jgi:FtsP/CotA-like multicopper oxidase with cupredoxin domain